MYFFHNAQNKVEDLLLYFIRTWKTLFYENAERKYFNKSKFLSERKLYCVSYDLKLRHIDFLNTIVVRYIKYFLRIGDCIKIGFRLKNQMDCCALARGCYILLRLLCIVYPINTYVWFPCIAWVTISRTCMNRRSQYSSVGGASVYFRSRVHKVLERTGRQ